MNTEHEEKGEQKAQRVTACILDLVDPARGDDEGEFQGYHLGASVSFIVVRVRDATPRRRGPGSAAA